MTKEKVLRLISQGRTELVFELFDQPEWPELLSDGNVKPLQWLVYYDDLTALKAVLKNGGDLSSIDLNAELGNAAFFGHWKICEFLISCGAEVNCHVDETAETPLHNALAKAGRPYFHYTVRLLVEQGADVNARTNPGFETGAFMRDIRTCGETPLHRAAAYSEPETISFLLENGANKEARDANGDSPLTWASRHLRPGKILSLLSFGEFSVGEATKTRNVSDHGAGWGNGMDWNLFGDYVVLDEDGISP